MRLRGADEAEARLEALLPLLRRAGSEVESTLTGFSMVPAIPHGAVIRIRCGALEACGVGDIVATQAGGGLRVHRVAYIGRPGGRAARMVVTRGDAMWLPDPPERVDALLGIVTAVRRDGSWSPPAAAGPPPTHAAAAVRVLASVLETSVSLASALGRSAVATRRLVLRARRASGRLLARLHRRAPQP